MDNLMTSMGTTSESHKSGGASNTYGGRNSKSGANIAHIIGQSIDSFNMNPKIDLQSLGIKRLETQMTATQNDKQIEFETQKSTKNKQSKSGERLQD